MPAKSSDEFLATTAGPNETGRLVRTLSPTGQQTDYTYEPRQAFGNRGLLASIRELLVQPNAAAAVQPTELVTGYHYDSYARLSRIDYPGNVSAPFSVKYDFDINGHVFKASDAAQPSTVYWQLLDADQGYRAAMEQLGNAGVVSLHTYDALTGSTRGIVTNKVTTQGTEQVQNLLYFYDLDGNMVERADLQASTEEIFDYDALHRLGPDSGYTYDSRQGRVKHQQNVGDYTYVENAGRDWVKSAGDYSYTHDDGRGNITTRSGPTVPGGTQEITYTAFNLPSQISFGNGDPALFAYNASGARTVKQVGAKSTFYAGDLYQATQSGATKNHRYMVYVGGQAVAAVSQDETAGVIQPRSVQYLHADALGSVQAITASDGTLSSTREFGAFGNSLEALSQSSSVPYGFTGQEHDPELGLINMHGRMYDPVIGQFLSPDPEMQQPFSQGFNRFAYTFNSPVNFTDPSGFRASNTAIGVDIGIGATYTAGLVATIASSGGGGAAVGAAAGAGAAEAAGAGLGVADAASIAGPIATVAMNVYFSSHQPVASESTSVKPTTRSSGARSVGSPSLGQVGRNPIARVTERNLLAQAIDPPLEEDDVFDAEVQWGQRLDPLPPAETNVSRVPVLPIIEEMNQRIAAGLPALPITPLIESPDVPCVEPLLPREVTYPEGSFSVIDWKGYPAGMGRPYGALRILSGDEYAAARALANETNAGIREASGLEGSGLQIHEIQPVKFGGSPTDMANKMLLPMGDHIGPEGVHPQFWNPLLQWAGGG